MGFELGPRRGIYVDIADEMKGGDLPLSDGDVQNFESFDLIYRALCAMMYNYVPMSGHPGGSISSGPIVESALFEVMDYDLSDPDRADGDMISYAAGHKALGLYGMWALRNEIARAGAPQLLAKDEKMQLRLEDLLGFRRNPVTDTPLFREFNSKALDGHPTPMVPFVKLATGASGVGDASSLGLGFAARDYFGKDAPRLHIIEGEGGMTPGRVAEAVAAAGTASLDNVVMHLDWNQASIDSNAVCRDGKVPGDYVQWDPMEFFYMHDWNVIYVADGRSYQQVVAAQRKALAMDNGQPTAVVYRTTKGWHYGIEGKASHGAGHKLCSEEYFKAIEPLGALVKLEMPDCATGECRCAGSEGRTEREKCYWEALGLIRKVFEENTDLTAAMAARLTAAKERLDKRKRKPRAGAPSAEKVYDLAKRGAAEPGKVPAELVLETGKGTTLRGELGKTLSYYSKASGGSILAAAADLLGSTSISKVGGSFPEGFFHTVKNPEARMLSVGGICEDAISGVLAGVTTFGKHIGAGSSYGAFMAPLSHIAARLHAIGCQMREEASGDPYKSLFIVCAHAGLKTGEDGPTHADPQALQLLQENFPPGTAVTLTPWDPQEVYHVVTAALAKRPAVIAPFVTRPSEIVPDRKALGLAPAADAANGFYALRKANGKGDGSVVLQGSGITFAFVEETLPLLEKAGIDLNVYYVASVELFDMLPKEERAAIFPEEAAREAMGISGFTLPTLYRWIRSDRGREMSLYPFSKGHFLGSGQADMVLKEAGLDGAGQIEGIKKFLARTGKA